MILDFILNFLGSFFAILFFLGGSLFCFIPFCFLGVWLLSFLPSNEELNRRAKEYQRRQTIARNTRLNVNDEVMKMYHNVDWIEEIRIQRNSRPR